MPDFYESFKAYSMREILSSFLSFKKTKEEINSSAALFFEDSTTFGLIKDVLRVNLIVCCDYWRSDNGEAESKLLPCKPKSSPARSLLIRSSISGEFYLL